MKTLFLYLQGFMQAWDDGAHFDIRRTRLEPTKSAVIGMLVSAMGKNGDELLWFVSENTRMGVRVDEPGVILYDFQAVRGSVRADGTVKQPDEKNANMITSRYYLCGAAFLVALQTENNDLFDELVAAATCPKRPIYLGRKNCVPSRPIFAGTGEYPTLADALSAYPLPETEMQNGKPVSYRCVVEIDNTNGVMLRDNHYRKSINLYAPRFVRDYYLIPTENNQKCI